MLTKAQRTMFCHFEAQVDNEEDDNQCAEELNSVELTLVFPMSIPANICSSVMPNAKHLCACNCGKLVTQETERWHEAGQEPSFLMSNILAQNQSLR